MRIPGVFSLIHLARGSALYGASDVVVALVRFSLIAVYTRIMQPAEFGLYSIIITSLTLAVVFIPLGIPSAVMLKMGKTDPAGSGACKGDAFWFLAGLCCMCGFVFYAASVFLFPHTLVRTLAPWLFLYASSEITGMVPKVSLRIKEKIAAYSGAKVARILFMAGLLFWLLATGVAGIKAVIIAECAASLLEWLLCMAFDRYVPAKPLFSNLMSLLHVGMPLMLVGFALFCIDLSDRYVVYELLGGQANGFYAAAAKVAVAASFFVEAFNSMWFPYYLRRTASANNTVPDQHLRRFASRLLVLFAAVTSLFMLVLPLFVKMHVFGRFFIAEQYHGVTVLVAPLTLGYFFKAAFYVSSTIVIARGKNWTLARAVYCAAIVNIGANVLWATLRPGPDLFATLCAIALSSSVSYAICMVLVSASAGLFPRRYWVTSKTAIFCAAILCLAFVPIPDAARYAAWVLLAAIGARSIRSTRGNTENTEARTGPT